MSEMEKIKILQIIPTLGGGGAEKFVLDLANYLDKGNFDIKVVSLFDKSLATEARLNYVDEKNIDVVFLDKKPGFDISLIFKLARLIKKEKPDIIHTNIGSYRYIAVLTWFLSFKHVHTMHSVIGNEDKISSLLLRINSAIRKTHFVTLLPVFESDMKKIYHTNDGKICNIANGVDSEVYVPINRDYDSDTTFITVGSLIPVKNHECILKAFFELEKVRGENDHLIVVGDGYLKQELVDTVNLYNLQDNVTFTGNVENVIDYLACADVYVCASHYEGVSLAILEAASTGLPMICSNTGGTRDIINDNGVLFDDDDWKTLEQEMLKMCTDWEYRCFYSNRTKNIRNVFSLENMVQKYEILYRNLCRN